jgi:hypothetical protein
MGYFWAYQFTGSRHSCSRICRYGSGLIGEEMLNGAIMMILVTCIIGPMIVEKFGLRLRIDTTLETEEKSDIRQRILVPLSNPATSARLVEFASNLKMQDKAPIYPLSVINTYKDAASQRDRTPEKSLILQAGKFMLSTRRPPCYGNQS